MKTHRKAIALLRTIVIVCFNIAIMMGTILMVMGGLSLIAAFGAWVFDACNRVPFHWNWMEFLGYGFVFTLPVLFLAGVLFLLFREEYQKQLNNLSRW